MEIVVVDLLFSIIYFAFPKVLEKFMVTYYVYKDMYTIYLYLCKIVLGEFVWN